MGMGGIGGVCGGGEAHGEEVSNGAGGKGDCSSGLVLFCFVLFCFILFCYILFCYILFCFVLFCFVLFCFVLFCFVLFCDGELNQIKHR